jgi:hypothetical protein
LTLGDDSARDSTGKLLGLVLSVAKEWLKADQARYQKNVFEGSDRNAEIRLRSLNSVSELIDDIVPTKWRERDRLETWRKVVLLRKEALQLKSFLPSTSDLPFTIADFLDRCLLAIPL